jgi:dinuclear metal center YbgI/SA1388 family protein
VIVRELLGVLESIAPLRYAEAWDRVGLVVGDPEATVERVLLAVDCGRAVLDEAQAAGCELVIAYHPPYLEPPPRLLASDVVFQAIRRGIGIYSPHTALDVAQGGTNDFLADVLGIEERAPLRVAEARATTCKLFVFVPEKDVDGVSRAMFEAGAGRIGNYSSCSFRTPGIGTFFGEEGARPAVGEAGKIELVPEMRVETVVPLERIDAVVRAMRAAHPYEEPAFDLVRLAAPPEGVGLGRVGVPNPRSREALFARVRTVLGVERLLVAGPATGEARRAAVCAGAGGALAADARANGVDFYLTGEMRHHDALACAAVGMTVVCTLHSASERAALVPYRARLAAGAPAVSFAISEVDRDPFNVR